MIHANQQKIEQAEYCFMLYSEYNPFSTVVWLCWERACQQKNMDKNAMLQTNRRLQKKYGKDGALLFGEGLAWGVLGEKEKAKIAIEQAHSWAIRKKFNKRAEEIKKQAAMYLGF
jgi:hypothetical protein